MPPLFIHNNRLHVLVCAKMISYLVRRVLSISKASIFQSTLQSAVASLAFMGSVHPSGLDTGIGFLL